MVVALRVHHVTPFAKTMSRDYVDAEAIRLAVASGESFNAVHFTGAIKVDFFVAGDDPFEAVRLQHRQRIEMPNGILYVDTAEHTLLRKLVGKRANDRPATASEVSAVLRACPIS